MAIPDDPSQFAKAHQGVEGDRAELTWLRMLRELTLQRIERQRAKPQA